MELPKNRKKGWKPAKQARAETQRANNPSLFRQRKAAAKRKPTPKGAS